MIVLDYRIFQDQHSRMFRGWGIATAETSSLHSHLDCRSSIRHSTTTAKSTNDVIASSDV